MSIKLPATLGVVILATVSSIAQNAVPSQPGAGTEASASPVPTSNAEDVALGEPLKWSPPKYPRQARKSHIRGTVVLMLKVNEDRRVSGGTVVSGDPLLGKSATDAVRKWEYVPFDMSGRPVAVTTSVIFAFNLDGAGRPNVSATFKQPPRPDLGPVLKVGDGVSAPKAIYSPEPDYSKEAQKIKYQGSCVLKLIVGPDGKTYDIKVDRSLGDGLDGKAIEAVRRWRFQPALKDGKPVAVAISVEVDFHLY